MFKDEFDRIDIDRICERTLGGRFGPSLIPPRQIHEFMCPSTPAVDVAVTLRNAAVWTSARSGIEQGKL